ncbi:hypothetical protein OVA24_16105 [Luteolibacter sp. SL250]|uniref:hypothetical protein n=1 Tax=Luteolibacter sp. SL250 TaxID=2995170 RepID=UPI00226E822B|nr:hypothetical protein [Luteolibacter sp. SL250]WAC18753.1 hypothetical protein OVA24_16105 [Luteolibacter sp. SL250]
MDQTSPTRPAAPVRLRSVQYRKPYAWAEILIVLNWLAAVAVLTCLPIVLLEPTHRTIRIMIVCVGVYVFTSLISFLHRRSVLCPLCKGTPLASSRAHVHPKATRIFPLDHATSAAFSLVFTQTFRCMYCASRFDLLKPRALPQSPGEADGLPDSQAGR